MLSFTPFLIAAALTAPAPATAPPPGKRIAAEPSKAPFDRADAEKAAGDLAAALEDVAQSGSTARP